MTRAARLVVGVIGHVDHGKTSLVRALTGTETDRLPEERRRGISIALGFAHLELDGASVDLIDMPGHERFVRTLISGATGVDAVLLVVAANEGIKPQTLEHLDVAVLLGLRRAAIAITKADLVPSDRLAEVAAAVAALAERAGLEAQTPVAVSAPGGEGIPALRAALAALLHGAAPAPDNAAPFLPIDRVFSVAGHGTVVTGTLRGGSLSAGQDVQLAPGAGAARIRGVQVHGARAATVAPGQRVAVNLRGIDASAVRPGAALSMPGLLRPSTWLTVQLRATASAPALPTTTVLRLLLGTDELDARLRLLDRDVLQPGDMALAQLRCTGAVAIPAREHVILRIASPALTVAGGRILDNEAYRLRRNDPAVLARLRSLADARPEELVRAEAAAAGMGGSSLGRLAALAGVGPALAAQYLANGSNVVLRGGAVVTAAALDAAQSRVSAALTRLGLEGTLPLGRLRTALPGIGAAVLDEALVRLAAAGTVRQDAGAVHLVQRDRDASRAAAASALEDRMAASLLRAGLTPPDMWVLAPDPPARRALAQLVRAGVAIPTTDKVQKRDLVFHRDAVAAARRRLTPLLSAPGLKVTEAGQSLGISRKYSVPLLEYLDSVQFTRRVEDRRVLGPGAAA